MADAEIIDILRTGPPKHDHFDMELIIRQSCGCKPAEKTSRPGEVADSRSSDIDGNNVRGRRDDPGESWAATMPEIDSAPVRQLRGARDRS